MSLFEAVGWLSLGGLALANSVATTAEMVVLLYLISKRMNGLEGQRLVGALWRMVLACLVMLVGLAITSRILSASPAWLVSAISMLVAAGIYGLVTLLLGSEEPVALMRGIRQRVGV
jgi:putative peptidoglycan lipid II flippase